MGDSITGEDREFIWTFLADAFAGVELSSEGLDRLRRLPISEIQRIFFDEISPVCAFNLSITTPEMEGFDPQWVKSEISRMLAERSASFVGRISYEAKAIVCKCISLSVWRTVRASIEA